MRALYVRRFPLIWETASSNVMVQREMVQREMEKRRSPLVWKFRPSGGDFQAIGGLSSDAILSVQFSSSYSTHPAVAWERCGRSVVGAQSICVGALTEPRARASCNPGPGLVRQTRRRAVEEWHPGLVLSAARPSQVPTSRDKLLHILCRKTRSWPEFITPLTSSTL